MLYLVISPTLVLLALVMASCAGKHTQPTAARLIDLSGIWDKPEKILLSSIATNIEYIPLETTPGCLLGEQQDLRVTILDNYIAISSEGLRLFDRHGKYLRTIGGIGKGPKEYSGSGEYVIDEKKGRVDILDNNRHRVFSYRITGEFIGEFEIKGGAQSYITRDPSGNLGIFYITPGEDENNPTRIEWISDSGEWLKSIPVYQGRPRGIGSRMAIFSSLYWSGDELLFNEIPFDTIYHVTTGRSWEPYWIVNVGPKRMPAEVCLDHNRFLSEMDRFIVATVSFETSRYVFFSVAGMKGSGVAVYDKTVQKSLLMMQDPQDQSGSIGFQNDLDGGLPFSPGSSKNPSGDFAMSLVWPLDLLAKFKDHPKSELPLTRPDLQGKLFKMVDRLRDDDNPVVMVVKLKTKEE